MKGGVWGVLLGALWLGMGCSDKPAKDAAPDPSTVALARADTTCPGATVKGCFDAALEADRKGEAPRAVELLTRVCDAGVAQACNHLGSFVWQGRGVAADPARAYSLYMKACEGGDPGGCFSAGICHRTGVCAAKSDADATRLLKRACEGGDKRACANLGGL